MPRRIIMGSVRDGVAVADNLVDNVAAHLDKVTKGAASRLERAAVELEAQAVARWPVADARRRHKSHSRDQFIHGIRIDDRVVAAWVRCRAPHAFYIKSAKIGGGTMKVHAWTELVRKPFKASITEVTHDLGLAALELGGGS